jgi:hypothetical protein
VAIWNAGTEWIDHSDIATPLNIQIERLRSSEAQILDAKIIHYTSLANQISVSVSDMVVIDFAFLDRNQGAIVQLIHSGLAEYLGGVTLTGTIKGLSEPIRREKLEPKLKGRRYVYDLMVLVTGAILFLSAGTLLAFNLFTSTNPAFGYLIGIPASAVLYGLGVWYVFLILRLIPLRTTAPEGFGVFFENVGTSALDRQVRTARKKP